MSKRLMVEVLGLWLFLPSAAAAQSFFLQAASLERDGEPVGEAARLPVEVVKWLDATSARVRHVDDGVTLEADVELTDPRDFLQAGVGSDQRLHGTGAWKVTMLRGTWAPVLRGSNDAIRIALPPELPVSWGRLVGKLPGAAAGPEGGPWSAAGAGEDAGSAGDEAEGPFVQHCPGLTVRSRPSLEDPAWPVPTTVHDIRKVGTRSEWYEVQVRVAGFGYGVDPDTLDRLAEADGTDNPGDPDHGYCQAANGGELAAALLAIGASVASCELVLTGRPADPSRIHVVTDREPLVRDDPDGFTDDETSNTITILGGACDALWTSALPNLQMIFGCPVDGGPPIVS
ncbi:MAG: hypothetical protein JXB32_09880 [Deltaproteobacteria bacterium]|nr:hypothetical protein [Deltaproteobacteria bacterium]